MTTGTDTKHEHGEAFCLMTYQCRACGHSEVFWNARDGVTPFGVRCDKCGEPHMRHVDWRADRYMPDYLPQAGQGVFITIPEELRIVVARRQVANADGTPYELQGQEREDMARKIAKAMHDGEPMLIRWR